MSMRDHEESLFEYNLWRLIAEVSSLLVASFCQVMACSRFSLSFSMLQVTEVLMALRLGVRDNDRVFVVVFLIRLASYPAQILFHSHTSPSLYLGAIPGLPHPDFLSQPHLTQILS